MSLTRKLGDRFKFEFASRIIVVVLGAVLTVLLARLLDPDGYGLLYLSISVLGIAELFSKLGIAKSGARYLTEYKETEPKNIHSILLITFNLNMAAILLTSIVLFIGYDRIATLIREPELAPFLQAGVLFVGGISLKHFVRVSLQGLEEIKISALLNVLSQTSRVVLALSFVILGYGAFGAFVGYILSSILVVVVGLGYLHKNFQSGGYPGVDLELYKKIARYSVPVTITSSANVLEKRIDTILVGFFIGPIAVAYYTIAKQVVIFIEAPASALGFTISPTFESQKVQGKSGTAARLYEEAISHTLLLYIPAAAGLIIVAEPLLTLLFGNEYLGAVPLLQILSIFAILQSITKLTSSGLDFLGRARERAIIKSIVSVLNVLLNLVLIPIIGVIGAAISTVFTYSIYTIFSMYIMRLELDFRSKWLLKKVTTILIITGFMSSVVYSLSSHISGFVSLFVVVGMGVVIWAVLSVYFGIIDVTEVLEKAL